MHKIKYSYQYAPIERIKKLGKNIKAFEARNQNRIFLPEIQANPEY